MNRVCTILLATISLFIISTSALATDYRHLNTFSFGYNSQGSHLRFGYSINQHHQNFGYRAKHHNRQHFLHKPSAIYKHWRQPRYGHRSFGYNSFGYRQPSYHQNRYNKHIGYKACHPVTKVIVGRHGKYHGVASTMCYDKYGGAYTISGRRSLRD